MNFNDIKINTHDEYNTFMFNNKEIKVLKYLSTEEKFDLVMTAIQKSWVNGVLNYIRLRTFFNLNIAYLYTDIQFEIEERVNEAALYDNLVVSGLMDMIRDNLEDFELVTIENMLSECVKEEKAYRNTAAAIISKIVDDLPRKAEAAKNIVDNFDKEKYEEVLTLAKDLNIGKLN